MGIGEGDGIEMDGYIVERRQQGRKGKGMRNIFASRKTSRKDGGEEKKVGVETGN